MSRLEPSAVISVSRPNAGEFTGGAGEDEDDSEAAGQTDAVRCICLNKIHSQRTFHFRQFLI